MTRQSDPGMRSDGKLSPRESQYSGDGSLWRRRGAGTGASVVTDGLDEREISLPDILSQSAPATIHDLKYADDMAILALLKNNDNDSFLDY